MDRYTFTVTEDDGGWYWVVYDNATRPEVVESGTEDTEKEAVAVARRLVRKLMGQVH